MTGKDAGAPPHGESGDPAASRARSGGLSSSTGAAASSTAGATSSTRCTGSHMPTGGPGVERALAGIYSVAAGSGRVKCSPQWPGQFRRASRRRRCLQRRGRSGHRRHPGHHPQLVRRPGRRRQHAAQRFPDPGHQRRDQGRAGRPGSRQPGSHRPAVPAPEPGRGRNGGPADSEMPPGSVWSWT